MLQRPLARLFSCFLLAAVALTLLSTPAEARRGGFGGVSIHKIEVLRPVADIDGTRSLCHLVKMRRVFGLIGVTLSSGGYVTGELGCTGDRYGSFTDDIGLLKAAGALPAAVPDHPRYSSQDVLEGLGGWIGLAVLLGIGLIFRSLRARKRKIRLAILSLEDGPAFRMIDVMCHAAIADGHIDPAEIAYIREVAREVTGLDYSDAHIRETITRADKLSHVKDMQRFASGLTPQQRRLILEAALSVVAADGKMEKRENRFIGLLCGGFGLTRDDLNDAMLTLARRRGGAVPA